MPKSSRTFIPKILDAFSAAIRPFDGLTMPSDEQVMESGQIIMHYAGLLQAADLSLSLRQAGAMLQARLHEDRKARLPEIAAEVEALINTPV